MTRMAQLTGSDMGSRPAESSGSVCGDNNPTTGTVEPQNSQQFVGL